MMGGLTPQTPPRARLAALRSASLGLTLAELLGTLGLVGILASLAMYGVATYLRRSKTAEAIAETTAIAQDACVFFNQSDQNQPAGTKPDDAKAMRHFPPSSRASVPASMDDVRGKRFQSALGDWAVSPWHDMDFKISTPQFYAYSFESEGAGSTATATAIAHGDLDGNGVPSTFRAHAAPDDSLIAKVKGPVEQVNPDE